MGNNKAGLWFVLVAGSILVDGAWTAWMYAPTGIALWESYSVAWAVAFIDRLAVDAWLAHAALQVGLHASRYHARTEN